MSEIEQLLEYKGWLVSGAFILLFVAERLRPAVRGNPQPFRRILKNLSFWPLNIALSLAVIFPVSYFAANNTLWVRPDWLSGFLVFAYAIVLLDLFLYF